MTKRDRTNLIDGIRFLYSSYILEYNAYLELEVPSSQLAVSIVIVPNKEDQDMGDW